MKRSGIDFSRPCPRRNVCSSNNDYVLPGLNLKPDEEFPGVGG
jgi:hypothetical protein